MTCPGSPSFQSGKATDCTLCWGTTSLHWLDRQCTTNSSASQLVAASPMPSCHAQQYVFPLLLLLATSILRRNRAICPCRGPLSFVPSQSVHPFVGRTLQKNLICSMSHAHISPAPKCVARTFGGGTGGARGILFSPFKHRSPGLATSSSRLFDGRSCLSGDGQVYRPRQRRGVTLCGVRSILRLMPLQRSRLCSSRCPSRTFRRSFQQSTSPSPASRRRHHVCVVGLRQASWVEFRFNLPNRKLPPQAHRVHGRK